MSCPTANAKKTCQRGGSAGIPAEPEMPPQLARVAEAISGFELTEQLIGVIAIAIAKDYEAMCYFRKSLSHRARNDEDQNFRDARNRVIRDAQMVFGFTGEEIAAWQQETEIESINHHEWAVMTAIANGVPHYRLKNWPDFLKTSNHIVTRMPRSIGDHLFSPHGFIKSNLYAPFYRVREALDEGTPVSTDEMLAALETGRIQEWAALKTFPELESCQVQYLLSVHRLVPPAILSRYPGRQPPKPAAWEMSSQEWTEFSLAHHIIPEGTHREYVEMALACGFDVPLQTMVEYPELFV